MKLSYVQIRNFRSIKDCRIDFDMACRTLVGINESGKSNVLQALRLLSDRFEVSAHRDVREPTSDEEIVKDSFVDFVFDFDQNDRDAILSEFGAKVLTDLSTESTPLLHTGKKTVSLQDLGSEIRSALYGINVLKNYRRPLTWARPAEHKMPIGWKKPSSSCPDDFDLNQDGKSIPLKSFALINVGEKNLEPIPPSYLEDASIDDLNRALSPIIRRFVKENLPEVVYWEFSEKDLLPSSVDIADFAANPDSQIPLRNMFTLAGLREGDIASTLNEKRKGTKNQFQNFLDGIAQKTTAHFREVWKEYEEISFSLRLDANSIVPGIRESNVHDFSTRSDGFKRFVTFLLMISAQVKSHQMKNALLIIDEPEISLHPSGARYLRDELIRISERNYVVFSTHSIFMIDPAEIARHYIVKKSKEITSLATAESSNLAEEEVLFNALGYSVLEVLRSQNVIFEGWKDKRLFEVALSAASLKIKRQFESIGICHARGASSLKAITPVLELAKRECVIVSDHDKPALQEKAEYLKDHGHGEWLTYHTIDNSLSAITGEDFIKKGAVANAVNAIVEGMDPFSDIDLPTDNNKLAAIANWLKKNGVQQQQLKATLSSIKTHIFLNLQASEIEPEYNKIVKGLSTRLQIRNVT